MGDDSMYRIEPNTYDTVWLGDRFRRTITGEWDRGYTITGSTSADAYENWATNPVARTWMTEEHANAYTEAMLCNKKEDIPKMITSESSDGGYIVSCSESEDLSVNRILKSLSIMKGKLEIDCAAIRVNRIECYMTPAVKTNIIRAGKRVAMYGKKRPFVARFDEYGNQLPDEISIDASERNDAKNSRSNSIRRFLFCVKSN